MNYHETVIDDAALVRAACEGDKQAFADIYDRYSNRVYSFARSVMRNSDDASDVLQDTFLLAGARLDQLRDPSKLRPWLFAIARHLATRSLAHTGKNDPLEDLQVIDPAPGPAQVAEQGELSELIATAAQGLGTQERIVLDLHLRQGLEGQELGDAIGVSAGHAYVLLSRMRDQVERSLGALLVARQGRKDCSDLENLLGQWDGRYTALWRKRIARHVDRCDICTGLRKRVVNPISLMAAVPLVPAPAEARELVLEQVRLVSFGKDLESAPADGAPAAEVHSEAWPARYHGFPPPMVTRRRTHWVVAAVVAAALVLGLGALAVDGFPSSGPPADPQLVFNSDPLIKPDSVPLEFPDITATLPIPTPQETLSSEQAPANKPVRPVVTTSLPAANPEPREVTPDPPDTSTSVTRPPTTTTATRTPESTTATRTPGPASSSTSDIRPPSPGRLTGPGNLTTEQSRPRVPEQPAG